MKMVSNFLEERLWHLACWYFYQLQTLCIFAPFSHFPVGMPFIWGIWGRLVEDKEVNSPAFVTELTGFTRARTVPICGKDYIGKRTDTLLTIDLAIFEVIVQRHMLEAGWWSGWSQEEPHCMPRREGSVSILEQLAVDTIVLEVVFTYKTTTYCLLAKQDRAERELTKLWK